MNLPDWWIKEFGDKPYCIMDCIEGMKRIPDKSIELLITDPPYGVGVDYGPTYDDTEENWFALMNKFIPEAKRIAGMVVFPAGKQTRLSWYFKNHEPYWIISWYKGSPGIRGNLGFEDWEAILVYGKNKGVQMHDHLTCIPQAFDNGHPCPKHVEWAAWFIKRMTNPGDVVLDPFLGSGTTLRACRETGRIGLGFEINPSYESIIKDRMMEKIPSIETWNDRTD